MDEKKHSVMVSDLQSVLDITRAMVGIDDLGDLLGLVINRSMKLLKAERASVFLYDRDSEQLITRVAAGVSEIRIPADAGIAGATIASSKTINVVDAYDDARFNPSVDKKTGFRTRNLISVPLFGHKGDLVGILQVINKIDGAFGEYDIKLAETLSAQAGVAIQRANLLEHYHKKLDMERAMMLARDIQQDLLPSANPAIDGFDIAGFTDPADETGGDAYDFFPLPNGRLMIVVADATGHGIGPALVMASTRATLRAITLNASNVPNILTAVNELLVADLDNARFVTCFFALLDPQESQIYHGSAGHGPILQYTAATGKIEEFGASGLPLGIMAGVSYDEAREHTFESGDFFIVTTDGFTETANKTGELYGTDRMKEFLVKNAALSSEEMIAKLKNEVTAYSQGLGHDDDLTAVVIKKI